MIHHSHLFFHINLNTDFSSFTICPIGILLKIHLQINFGRNTHPQHTHIDAYRGTNRLPIVSISKFQPGVSYNKVKPNSYKRGWIQITCLPLVLSFRVTLPSIFSLLFTFLKITFQYSCACLCGFVRF